VKALPISRAAIRRKFALGAGETVQVSSDGGTTWANAAQSDATH
jgi:hypothetical protein